MLNKKAMYQKLKIFPRYHNQTPLDNALCMLCTFKLLLKLMEPWQWSYNAHGLTMHMVLQSTWASYPLLFKYQCIHPPLKEIRPFFLGVGWGGGEEEGKGLV